MVSGGLSRLRSPLMKWQSVGFCASCWQEHDLTQMKNESAHRGKKERRTWWGLCVPCCILLLALSAWIDGPGLAPSTGFPFPRALTGLSSGEAHQETRGERSQVVFIAQASSRLGCLQAARVLQVKASAPCKTVTAIEPFPPGSQSPCLHLSSLGGGSSSAVIALGCFTISWISPTPCPRLHK